MEISVLINNLTVLMVIIGVLVILTNIIVEVLKNFTWEKIHTNVLAVLVALILTLVAFFAWAAFMGIAVLWYYVAAAVVVAFMVAYGAMVGFDKLFSMGFDKLREIWAKVKMLKG